MISDLWIVLRWWGTLFLVGAAAFPLTSVLFAKWHDRGYLFTKAVGMATVSWIVFALGMAHIAPFTVVTVVGAVLSVFIIGLYLRNFRKPSAVSFPTALVIIIEEIFFLFALLAWSWVKAHEPSIRSLEKFMDYGFMNSILHSRFFPPADMWYPPYPINYYYFGHLVTAVLTRLSGLDLSYTFNLMLATIFALCLTMSFSIGFTVISGIENVKKGWGIVGGLVTAFLVTLAGNMQTIYAFTQGYDGDKVKPFWQLLWPASQFFANVQMGMNRYWYANATRFIPYTIHEFPGYSFVVSDVHGHVLSIPFVLLALALLIVMWAKGTPVVPKSSWVHLVFYGFLCGVLLMTNALDGPIYLGLFLLLVLVLYPGDWTDSRYWRTVGLRAGAVVAAMLVASLPFLAHFKSFVNGIAVDCPPQFLANTKIGPILFEGVEKCQKSPFWMMYLLWGFFWVNGVWLIFSQLVGKKKASRTSLGQHIMTVWNTGFTQTEKVLTVWFVFSVLLLIFPEFFYFKDIYPMHFRSNTMFKLGYQAYIMCSILSGYVIARTIAYMKSHISYKLFLLVLAPQLFLVSIYPLFSVKSYFGNLTTYHGLWGSEWLSTEYPDNYAAIQWLNEKASSITCQGSGKTNNTQRGACDSAPVIVEADGDSYTDYDQFSVFTGSPTIVGWAVHEWLWRGSYDVVAPRRDQVRTIYESDNVEETKNILSFYNVRYIIVGLLERQKFTHLNEQKLATLGTKVFVHGATTIYAVRQD